MKILFLSTQLSWVGGIQRYNRDVIHALKKLGVEVYLVELRGPTLFHKIVFILEAIAGAVFAKPSATFCSHVNFLPISYYLHRIVGIQYVAFTYGIEVWNLKNERAKIEYLREAIQVVTISKFTFDKMVSGAGISPKRITMLPPTVNGDEFDIQEGSNEQAIKKLGLKVSDEIILTVARLNSSEAYKGYDKVIEILPDIKRKHPRVKYVLVGEGNDRERVESLVKRLNLQDSVVLTGRVSDEDLARYYNLARVFIMPSKGEGFGIVFLEALACGTPVIAGNKDGSRDAVLNGETGFLIDPDNRREIEETLLRVLEGEAPGRLLDKHYLRTRIMSEFGLDSFSNRIKILLSNLWTQKELL